MSAPLPPWHIRLSSELHASVTNSVASIQMASTMQWSASDIVHGMHQVWFFLNDKELLTLIHAVAALKRTQQGPRLTTLGLTSNWPQVDFHGDGDRREKGKCVLLDLCTAFTPIFFSHRNAHLRTRKTLSIIAQTPLLRFVVNLLCGGVKWQWGCRRRQFLEIWVATSSETLEIRPAILHGDMFPLVGLYW